MKIYADVSAAYRRQAILFHTYGIATGVRRCDGGWSLLYDPPNGVLDALVQVDANE